MQRWKFEEQKFKLVYNNKKFQFSQQCFELFKSTDSAVYEHTDTYILHKTNLLIRAPWSTTNQHKRLYFHNKPLSLYSHIHIHTIILYNIFINGMRIIGNFHWKLFLCSVEAEKRKSVKNMHNMYVSIYVRVCMYVK